MKQKPLRLVLDLAMTLLLPLLMAYSLIGETFHEVAGTVMFALFIIHHVQNRRWQKSLFRGQYSPYRVFQTVLNVLLFLFMILQPVSGILLSKHLFVWLPEIGSSAVFREWHLMMAYWGFILLSLHAGTHLTTPLRMLWKRSKNAWHCVFVLLLAGAVYGCLAFIKRRFAIYLFGISHFANFDFNEPRVYFLLDYLAVMVLFMVLGYGIARGLKHSEK